MILFEYPRYSYASVMYFPIQRIKPRVCSKRVVVSMGAETCCFRKEAVTNTYTSEISKGTRASIAVHSARWMDI